MVAGHVPRARRRAGRRVRRAVRYDAERHPEGVPVPRHLHLPTRGVEAADGRSRRVHGAERSRLEPDQRVPVPLARSGRDAGAGARVRLGERDRSARRGARVGSDPRGRVPASGRAHLVLHRRERSLRRRDVQDARVHADVGPHLCRALRRHRREATPLPLWHAGELARPHRGTAREQRAAHRARDVGRHALEGRARAGHPASVLERSARPADTVGPAVVVAHPASARVRIRLAGIRRLVRRIEGRRGQGRRTRRRGRGRAAVGTRRRRLVRDDRRHERPARASPRRARAAHRVGRAEGRRRQLVHRDRALSARSTARPRAASSRSTPRSNRSTSPRSRSGARRAIRPRSTPPSHISARSRPRPRTSSPPPLRSRGPAEPSANGPARCARSSASTARLPV